jgi:hypothetical protein
VSGFRHGAGFTARRDDNRRVCRPRALDMMQHGRAMAYGGRHNGPAGSVVSSLVGTGQPRRIDLGGHQHMGFPLIADGSMLVSTATGRTRLGACAMAAFFAWLRGDRRSDPSRPCQKLCLLSSPCSPRALRLQAIPASCSALPRKVTRFRWELSTWVRFCWNEAPKTATCLPSLACRRRRGQSACLPR